jgi:Protein of unknown function (DUF2786)/SprT-like family
MHDELTKKPAEQMSNEYSAQYSGGNSSFDHFIKDWERLALLQLQSSYSQLLQRHRIKMPLALVELFDSTTYWGQWRPEENTIRISRKLLINHPWFHVLGVLQHEMAHQYVDKVLTREASVARDQEMGGPHGELFKMACRKLGVPSQYARASSNLQTDALDWRAGNESDPQNAETEKMLEKVRKLLALAGSTNEHEAVLAMNRVREIYAKYNLNEEERPEYYHFEIALGGRQIDACTRMILSILMGHFFVQVITSESFDVRSGTMVKSAELIGRRENVLMAEHVFYFLKQNTDALAKARKTARGRMEKKSFRLGILHGFAEKLEAANSPWQNSPGQNSAAAKSDASIIHRALVAHRSSPALRNYLKMIYPNLRSASGKASRVQVSAFSEGKSEGRKLTLNRPVTSGNENTVRFLTGRN